MASGELTLVGGNTGLRRYNLVPYHSHTLVTFSATANTFTTLLSLSGKGLLSKAIIYAHNTYLRRMRITIDGVVVLYLEGRVNGASYNGTVGLLQTSDTYLTNNSAGTYNMGTEVNGNTFGFSNTAQYPLATLQSNTTAYGNGVALSGEIKFTTSLLIEVNSSFANDSAYAQINYFL